MNFTSRYSSICGLVSSLVLITLILSSAHCQAFLMPHHPIAVPKTTTTIFQGSESTLRNRFWGSGHGRTLSTSRNNIAVLSTLWSGPSVLDRPTTTTKKEQRVAEQRHDQRTNETWEVRLYNDGLNTREHVSRSLVQVTGLSEYQAYHTMMQAHQNGMAVVGQYYYEIAEMFHDALKCEGIICDIVPLE